MMLPGSTKRSEGGRGQIADAEAPLRSNDYLTVLEDIALCPHDQGRLVRPHDAALKCDRCGRLLEFRGVVADLSAGDEHQITAAMESELPPPTPRAAGAFYQSVFGVGIERARLPDTDLRVLEVGTGRGVLSAACLAVKRPKMYLATDIFPVLMADLYPRLIQWSSAATQVAVGTLDATTTLNVRPGSINLVQGKGVLHHILDYTRFMVACSRVLAKPGAIIFTEPLFDGWLYFVSMIHVIEHLDERKALRVALSTHTRKKLMQRRTSLSMKLQKQGDLEYLKQFGDMDKHIFSVRDFDHVASLTGMHWSIIRDQREIGAQMARNFKRLVQTPEELAAIEAVIADTTPSWPNNALFSDLRAGICFHW
jgi:2-polyprenyl-3-methyl-5-hydroxy-6-metoxy-1,4-benzoquinol methylase